MAKTSKKAPVKKEAKKVAKKAVTKPAAVKTDKKVKYPEKYTASSMIGYISEKHSLTKNIAKDILESVFDVINSGVISGQRVPVGKFGKMYVKVRPARKARKGRNPITGEEITIPPKKATKIPKFIFSKSFKESALKAKAKD